MTSDVNTWESRTLAEKWEKPQQWWYEDRDAKRRQAKQDARQTVRDEDVVVLGDADADGLGAVAVVREVYDDDVAFVSCGPHGGGLYLGDALWVCTDELSEGATVIVQDVAVDDQWKVKALPEVADIAGEILWFDHHEWDDSVASFAAEHVDHFVVDDGEDDAEASVYDARCAAMMVRDYYEARGHEFSTSFNEAVNVTGEYDLWRLRDDRCHDLNDLTHVVDHDEYVSLVRTHGADVLNDDAAAEAVTEYRAEQSALHDRALDHVRLYEFGNLVVAGVYGNCPINDVAETVRERDIADATVFSFPHGGLSLRGSDAFEQCHVVAEQFGGGGHSKAAGAGLYNLFSEDDDPDTDSIPYSVHWETNGDGALETVVAAFEDLETVNGTPTPL